MTNIVILISGRGSNMQAIVNAAIPEVRVAAVIANRADAAGLAWAAARGIPTAVLDHKAFAGREAFDAALAGLIDGYMPDLVVLAGFMRILTPGFVNRYAGRLINIHPSLLPAFTGLHTHERALAEGVKFAGCTVHFVTAELDHGPIIAQAVVPVADDDTPETLAARVLVEEHRLYPEAVRLFAQRRLVIEAGRVRVAGAAEQGA
ncbi:phosphoribosylglycinamide formyltransferase [Chitiniphilus purpureus]|uniref:Phosphoribosylglycinamide formyltransferase n=1 Tax=Chitiniphilus purpureus TaxID=2981137 RepID=A0ABY6DLP1_9NEIS|nr:phosphoribosylglycinamide formyltransferase [Chitiniphilus sp. CD1]UXY15259.1 phosphoribosylglycinamide formyltransferase [Chitiniphilus sp. CD1]